MTDDQFWKLAGMLILFAAMVGFQLRRIANELYRIRLNQLRQLGEISQSQANELASQAEKESW